MITNVNGAAITAAQARNSAQQRAPGPDRIPRAPKARALAAARQNGQHHLAPVGGPQPAFDGATLVKVAR